MFSSSPINGALTVGLAKRLWDTEFDLFLDGIANVIYHSPMKQLTEQEETTPSQAEEPRSVAGATLFS